MELKIKGSNELEQAIAEFKRAEKEFKQAALNLSRMNVEVSIDARDVYKK